MKSSLATALSGVVILLSLASRADAGLVAELGNPTAGPTSAAAANGGKTTLIPSPAVFVAAGACPWLMPALAAQKFSAAEGWEISTANLAGDIKMNVYAPWVDGAPAIGSGDIEAEATEDPGFGGAVITLNYTPQESEAKIQFHWIQVIHTNAPSPEELAFGSKSGAYINALDNSEDGQDEMPTSPYYDGVHAADATDFIDNPARPFVAGNDGKAIDFQAQVFLASGDLANKKLTIYDGVWWGFTNTIVVPEPATFVLAGLGSVAILMHAARKRLVRAA